MPFYPANSSWYPARAQSVSHNQELVPIIIQFNGKALLDKYPGLKAEEFKNHPYRQQLASEYNDWINQIQEKLRVPHMDVRHKLDLLVSGIAVTLPKDQAEKLKDLQLPFIKAVYLDEKATLDEHPSQLPLHTRNNNPRIQQRVDLNQYNLEIIGMPAVRGMTDTSGSPLDGRGVCVAVLDHGFDTTRLRFGSQGSVDDQYNLDEKNTTVFTPNWEHGTMITQIILDVAPNVQVLVYKTTLISSIVAGLERAVEKEAEVVNISLKPGESDLIIDAANTAEKNNVIVVNSSGNDSAVYGVDVPGRSPEVISVGAINEWGYGVASFSNYDNLILKPNVVAPGYYQFPSGFQEGTSFASAYVSGAAALILQMHPDWYPNDVKSALCITATPISERDPSAVFSQGSGRINIPSAIQTDTLIFPVRYISLREESERERSMVLEITNTSNLDKEYVVRSPQGDEIEISHPSSITVPATFSRKVPFTITIKTPTEFKNFAGEIEIISGDAQWHIPLYIENVDKGVSSSFFELGPVSAIAFVGDWYIAVGSTDGKVRIRELPTLALVHVFDAGASVTSIASSSGDLIAAGLENGKVQIWELSTRQLRKSLNTSAVNAVAFSPGGDFIAAGLENGKVQIWELSTWKLWASINTGNAPSVSIAYSPDGKLIASGSYNATVQIWELSTQPPGEPKYSYKASGSVFSVAFSPDKPLIALGVVSGVQLWDFSTDTPKLKYFLKGSNRSSHHVAFSPSGGRIGSASFNGKVQVWDLLADIPVLKYSFDTDARVSSVAFYAVYPEEGITSGSKSGKVQLWGI